MELYKLDIDFIILTGSNIVRNFENSYIGDRELVAQLRGYVSCSVMAICKLAEIIEFIIKSKQIEFNSTTTELIKEIAQEYEKVKIFRNHYIAHPVKFDRDNKTKSLLPISEMKEHLKVLLNLTKDETPNDELIKVLKLRADKLERHKNIIDYITNCIPKPWLLQE